MGYRIPRSGSALFSRCIYTAAQPELVWPELHRAIFFRFFRLIPVPRQRINREGILVQVVLQVKHAWKPGPGKLFLAPPTVRVLLFPQGRRRSRDGCIVTVGSREQSNQSPRRLRRGAVSLPLR